MQNLRKSLQNKSSSGGLNPNRPQATLAPPRKVIKALYDYNSQQSEELSFVKGDFFHVVGNEDDEDWYEACNPISGARGYVPVTYFQILEKNQRNSGQGLDDSGNDSAAYAESSSSAQNQGYFQQQPQQQQAAASNGQAPKGKFQPLYGIVLYDFKAERPDELDAQSGDAILVIAKSNDEWYVAKPIGRLGGPGLIPVSFIEIRDMVSGKPINVQELLRQTGTSIPRVEEWKKQALEYKANSIPLGSLEAQLAQPQQQPQQQAQQQQQQQQNRLPQPSHGMHPQQYMQQQQANNNGPTLQQLKNKMSARDLKSAKESTQRAHTSQDFEGNRQMAAREESTNGRYTRGNGDAFGSYDTDPTQLVNAAVESYHHEDDQYWFTVRIEYTSGATRTLYRVYEDFYNFHIALLEEFPVESGRVGDQPRILPFMPIPLQVVTEAVTASRRADLDGYVKDLCGLPARITQHPLVEQLFALRDGDVEIPPSSGNGSISPPHGRSTPSGNMFHSATDRRASPSGGVRSMLAKQGPGSFRHSDDPPSANASPSLRSQASFATPAPSSTSEDMIKVKISFQEDIMAMRIPVTITFQALQQKIFDRLETSDKELSYRDERGDFARIQEDADVREAIDHSGGKLMIYVD
ncbi:bud emergence protein 1 [Mortierella sp. NVP85]|nr:bud emergence protein 1 [Mortierella sp. NVP85]